MRTSARPTTATAMRRRRAASARAGRRRGRLRRLRRLRRHLRGVLRRLRRDPRHAAARPGPRRRPALRHGDHLPGGRLRRREGDRDPAAGGLPGLPGQRRRAGHQADSLPAVQRHRRGAPGAADDPGPVRQRHAPVRAATASARSPRRRAPTAAGRSACRRPGSWRSASRPAWTTGCASAWRTKASRASAAARPGSLYVVLHVKPHPLFQRQENDILLELPDQHGAGDAGRGSEVPTLDGKAKLTIPPGTQHGAVFRLRGKGVPILRSNRRGRSVGHRARASCRRS